MEIKVCISGDLYPSFLQSCGLYTITTGQETKPGITVEHTPYSRTVWFRKLLVFSLRNTQGGGSCRKQTTCPCHVLSCLEKAVWISSQLRLDEAHYAFRSCSRSLPAALLRALPGHNRNSCAEQPRRCWTGSCQKTSPEASGLALPGRWGGHSVVSHIPSVRSCCGTR